MESGPSLRGVYVALATPLHADGSFDPAGTNRLLDYVMSGGVHGVVCLGSTGELTSLPRSMRGPFIQHVARQLDGTVPLIAGVAEDSIAETVIEIEQASQAGATAALVAPPHYSPIDQTGVYDFYAKVAAQVEMPLIVYHIPSFTGVTIAPETIQRLVADGIVVGLKDSGGDFEFLQRTWALAGATNDASVLTGDDSMLLAALVAGVTGAIAASPNVAPWLAVQLYEAYAQGRLDQARDLQAQLLELVITLRVGMFPAGIKAALELIGVCGPWPMPPGRPLSRSESQALQETLRRRGILREASTRMDALERQPAP